MENIKELGNKKKLLPIILAGVAIIIVIVLIVLASSKKEGGEKKPVVNKTPAGQQGAVGEDGMPLPGEGESGEVVDGEDMTGDGAMAEVNPVLVDAKAVVAGTNLISKDNKVITDAGIEIRTDVGSADPEAPRQTVMIDKDTLPASVIKIDATATGFTPSEFTVKKGEPITIALTAADEWAHTLNFNDPKLSAIFIGPSSGTTRALTFNAPTEAGEYTFYCANPGHINRGETGKMIVK